MAEAFWIGENKDKLTELWNAGLSARDIAAEFPGSTRNAVIGAARRIGLPRRENPRSFRSSLTPYEAPIRQHIPIAEPDNSKLVSLLDRKGHQCRFIAGEDYLYCGHDRQKGSSYCPYHHRVVWEKSKRGKGNRFVLQDLSAGVSA